MDSARRRRIDKKTTNIEFDAPDLKSKMSSASSNIFKGKKNVAGIVVTIVGVLFTSYYFYKTENVVIYDVEQNIKTHNIKEEISNNVVEEVKFKEPELEIDVDGFHINERIIEGETDEDLHMGVVHQKGSALPSAYGGNVVITGHRWYPGDGPFSKVFFDLDKLKEEDKIIIKYKNKKYTYVVESSQIVTPEDTSFLGNTAQSTLTLYTCHPKYTSDKRLVVRAALMDTENL